MVSRRLTAAKLSIQDIIEGSHITRQDGRVIGVETHLGQVNRVNVIATVVDRFEGTRDEEAESKRFVTITLDDNTGVIRVKVWGEHCERLEHIRVGDLVRVIGKIRSFQDETYINGEIVHRLEDPNWETLRLLELIQSWSSPHPLKQPTSPRARESQHESTTATATHQTELTPSGWRTAEETLEQQAEQTDTPLVPAELRRRVMQVIEKHDSEGGAHFEHILKAAGNASEEEVEQVLIDLLSEGIIYEPEIHRYKKS